MPTFYDLIELEDIDVNDPLASFYLIRLPNNGFKFCATTSNLSQLQFEPGTRIPGYWPITREQLSRANFAILFPNGKLRSEPFSSTEELNLVFHFDPPFNPMIPQHVFGHARPLAHDLLTPFTEEWRQQIIQHVRQSIMSEEQIAIVTVDNITLSRVANMHLFPLDVLANFDTGTLRFIVSADPSYFYPPLQSGRYTLQNILEIYNQAIAIGMEQKDVKKIFQCPSCVEAIVYQDILLQDLAVLGEKLCVVLDLFHEIQMGLFTREQLASQPVALLERLVDGENREAIRNGDLTLDDFIMQFDVINHHDIGRKGSGNYWFRLKRILSVDCMLTLREACFSLQELIEVLHSSAEDSEEKFYYLTESKLLSAMRQGRAKFHELKDLTMLELRNHPLRQDDALDIEYVR